MIKKTKDPKALQGAPTKKKKKNNQSKYTMFKLYIEVNGWTMKPLGLASA